jgi:magnesium-transporting ATPase (P-type)
MGSKALLENRLDYKPQVDSPKRGLLIGYIPLSVENLSGFLSSLEEFRNTSAPLEADKYKVIAEFHFNNFYRECEDQTTRRGVERLQDAGYSFYMITGDSLVTARDIGLELGIIGTEGMVIDGMEFMKLTSLEKDNVILELLDKGTGIFGNTRAIYKEKIVELFQKHRRVVFLGDQENDYLAIKKADLGIVQERGNKKCKNIGHVIGKIPTETAFYYLSKYRDIGIDGKWWFYKELVRFNYTTAGIWLMGIGPKLNLLFIDPWEPLHSLIMSISITMLLVYKSITFRNTKVNYDSITYYTPLYSLAKALFIGLLVSMVLTELYSKLSILIISTVMVFSI